MKRYRIPLSALISILLIAGVTTILRNKNAVGFSGDGVLSDSGMLSYPQYRIAFENVLLSTQTNRVFVVKGLPSTTMTAGLELVTNSTGLSSDERLEKLRHQGAELTVRIETDKGELAAHVQASLTEWELAHSQNRNLLWHPKLRDLRFNRASAYRIQIGPLQAKLDAAPLLVRPVIEGGGNELP